MFVVKAEAAKAKAYPTKTLGKAINLHQCSVMGHNGYYGAFDCLFIFYEYLN